jgi:hypothetical protein
VGLTREGIDGIRSTEFFTGFFGATECEQVLGIANVCPWQVGVELKRGVAKLVRRFLFNFKNGTKCTPISPAFAM